MNRKKKNCSDKRTKEKLKENRIVTRFCSCSTVSLRVPVREQKEGNRALCSGTRRNSRSAAVLHDTFWTVL